MNLILFLCACTLPLLHSAIAQVDTEDYYCDVDVTKQCGVNEVYNDCGNICEVNCQNYGTPPKKDPVQNPGECIAKCACKNGYIRNSKGACVADKPHVCTGNSYNLKEEFENFNVM
jgi:Trypsin Inhibitor like cysteine rich domain